MQEAALLGGEAERHTDEFAVAFGDDVAAPGGGEIPPPQKVQFVPWLLVEIAGERQALGLPFEQLMNDVRMSCSLRAFM